MNNTRKLHVKLKPQERAFLAAMLRKGKHSVRALKRAQYMVFLDEGYSSNQIAKFMKASPEAIRRRGWLYVRHGLHRALYDAPRPGQKRVLSDEQSNQIIALACSQAPDGYQGWTIKLILQEAVKRGILKKKVGLETIRLMFHRHSFKPWREKNVVRPSAGSAIRRAHGRYTKTV